MSLAPLTVSDATAIIARRCAGWCVESIEFLGEGDFCAGFLVNRDWVFRFAKHEKAAASLNREARLLPQIARQFDVMIPSPEFGGFEDTPAFIAYRALPGLALTQDRYLQLSESDRDRCAFQVGVFLRQMHATDLKLARSSGLEHADYAAHFDGLSKQVAQALWSKLCITERALVKRTIADLLESHGRARFRPALLHGDLSPDHVLYDPDSASVMAVIDFGDMIIGDPAWDFICIYEDYGPDFLFRALREYGPADQVALLIRMHRLYLLGAIEWTVQLFEREAEDAEASVAELIETLEVQSSKLDELLSNGLARETS